MVLTYRKVHTIDLIKLHGSRYKEGSITLRVSLADACHCVILCINKYLTVKLTDNLISQSSTGGKSSFYDPKLAILQVSVHASLNSAHCDLMTEKLLSDWLKCVLKLPCQGRTLSLTQNRK